MCYYVFVAIRSRTVRLPPLTPPPLFVKIGKIPQFFSIAKTGKPGGIILPMMNNINYKSNIRNDC